ncbi:MULTISPECIES: hypothetical protein [unclassified Enterobacter]|uniref:hypothetical protein n=1 Tax=unclassified Enterobacter TaxID=2608935 RepID=UPI0003ED148E|nr:MULTISPECIES: hypothetical protein [unclassified Enterobacter]EWG67618.1 hypothetical protein P349_04689 [Enterobacter sp. DC4]EWG69846.1 hypothetical protein P348_02462 [Enterobacter sp. DC3]
MRIIKCFGLVLFCCLIYLIAYLALKNFQSEGMSFKTCALIAAPLLIWMVYLRVNSIYGNLHVSESDEAIFMRMQEQITIYEEMERVAGGRQLMKGILECRQLAQVLVHPEKEEVFIMLSRLAYIERLMNALVPGLCGRMSEGERQMWARMINDFPAITVNGTVSDDTGDANRRNETQDSHNALNEVR